MREIKFKVRYNGLVSDYRLGNPSPFKDGCGTPIDMSVMDVCQYTGLKDRNSVEIFEGDIVRYSLSYNGKPPIVIMYTVEYGYAGFIPFKHDGSDFNACSCEIIGNIHENPELIGEDK